MAQEKLSQSEIDALFGGISNDSSESTEKSAAEGTEKKYKVYDFKNPKIFSKEQLRSISVIYDNYAKHLTSFCSGVLRTDCIITVESIQEQKYNEYSNTLPESMFMGVLDVKPLEGNMLVEIKKDSCYTVIDRLLGGTGDNIIVQEDFSEIELKLMEKFMRQIIRFLKDSWSSVTELDPKFDRVETNARLTQIMPFEEIVIIVLLNFKIKEHMGLISICIPCLNLDNILKNAQNYMMFNRRKTGNEYEHNKKTIFDNLQTSRVDVKGVLGQTSLTLQELLQLQIGDVIPLDKPIDSPVALKVGNLEWFNGEIGVKRNKRAIKIKQITRST